MEKIKTMFTALSSAFMSFFGLLAIPILLLVSSNIIDYITGLMATSNRNEKISSYKGIKGIFKKVAMYLLIIVGYMIDVLIQYSTSNLGISLPFRGLIACIVAIWIVCNEIISILENLIDIGVELPSFLMPLIKLIKSKTEQKIETSEKEGNE